MSSNALGRVYLLARVVQRRWDAQVLGATFDGQVWRPADTGEFEYFTVPGGYLPGFARQMWRLAVAADGDVVIAVKPRPSSFGVALLARRRRGVPIVLDIDDWDVAGTYGASRLGRWTRELARLPDPYSNLYLHLLQARVGWAQAITVASRGLQARFGGTLLPHGRDTEYMDPRRHSGSGLRADWGVGERPVVMFLGTPRPHKGIDDLIQAVAGLADLGAVLVIVGVSEDDPYCRRLAAQAGPGVIVLGMCPILDVPRHLAAADVVAIPQRGVPFAHAQLPAKLFDAMAMARPIVASAVSDLPEVLDGCGLLVPPADVTALASALRQVLSDRHLATRLGRAARDRCIKRYSWDVMETTLARVLDGVLA
jgi:glycosyltransferase involved in cell wall biosynthesis